MLLLINSLLHSHLDPRLISLVTRCAFIPIVPYLFSSSSPDLLFAFSFDIFKLFVLVKLVIISYFLCYFTLSVLLFYLFLCLPWSICVHVEPGPVLSHCVVRVPVLTCSREFLPLVLPAWHLVRFGVCGQQVSELNSMGLLHLPGVAAPSAAILSVDAQGGSSGLP